MALAQRAPLDQREHLVGQAEQPRGVDDRRAAAADRGRNLCVRERELVLQAA